MNDTYITALTESLEKKIKILEEIRVKNAEQYELAVTNPISYEALDKNAEEKGVLIYKLTKLDEGFETVYANVKDELNSNRDLYAERIKKMQELITRITELSTSIQAEETRNKSAIEKSFKSEREKIKSQRSGVKAIQSYTKAMNSTGKGFLQK